MIIDIVGDGIAYSVGANFTPHVLTVNAGEVYCAYCFYMPISSNVNV